VTTIRPPALYAAEFLISVTVDRKNLSAVVSPDCAPTVHGCGLPSSHELGTM
jgi:hypothetical protein